MVKYIKFEPGEFFHDSPEIRILKAELTPEEYQIYTETREEVDRNNDRGLDINPSLCEPRYKERDGHLSRLKGVQSMDAFLRWFWAHILAGCCPITTNGGCLITTINISQGTGRTTDGIASIPSHRCQYCT